MVEALNRPVALVTGARTGVGLELTRRLLGEGWDVVTLTRAALPSEQRLVEATAQGRLRQYMADLADYASLRSAIAEITAQELMIDVLFNNAGVNPASFETSPQGREMCYEVNTVVPYILAQELRPLLIRGTYRMLVNTSSNALLMLKAFEPATLGSGKNFQKLFGAYSTSKLALSLWTKAMAIDFAAQGVSAVSVDPGPTKTPLTAGDGMPWWLRLIAKVAFKPPTVAVAKLHAVAFSTIKHPPGSFVLDGAVKPLPFIKHEAAVLDRIDCIYRNEYLP